jgi:hypothetical protein
MVYYVLFPYFIKLMVVFNVHKNIFIAEQSDEFKYAD